MAKTKKSAAPEIMIPSERGKLDKALSQVVNAGETSEDALRRLYLPKNRALSDMTDFQIGGLHDKSTDLLGHLALEKHGISDADPKMVQKLLKKEYGGVADALPSIIAENDPQTALKKYMKAKELGYLSPEDVDDLMFKSIYGVETPFADKAGKIAGPAGIAIAPGLAPVRAAGVGLHEFTHGIEDVETGNPGYQDYKRNLAEIRKQTNDPIEAMKMRTAGHHEYDPHFETAKANNIIKGVEDLDDIKKAKLKRELVGRLSEQFGEGFKKVRSVAPVIGPAIGAYAALNSGDAAAAIPILNEAGDAGQSGADEKQMLAEHDAQVNYDSSPAGMDADKKKQALRAAAVRSLAGFK